MKRLCGRRLVFAAFAGMLALVAALNEFTAGMAGAAQQMRQETDSAA